MSKKRIVVITGTSRGIGRGLAQHFLRQGNVVCGCSRQPATIRHRQYRHFTLDVVDEKAVVAIATQDLLSAVIASRWSFFTHQSTGALANAMATEADRASFRFMSHTK